MKAGIIAAVCAPLLPLKRILAQGRTDQSSSGSLNQLSFTIPPGRSFKQDTYVIEHDALGAFYLFIVPVSPQSKQNPDFYEAVIYRREMYWTDKVSKMTKKKPLALTTSQAVTTSPSVTTPPTQPKQSISNVAPLLILLGNQDAQPNPKEESDVYRFRPEALAPPVAAEQANAPAAPDRRANPLCMTADALHGARPMD